MFGRTLAKEKPQGSYRNRKRSPAPGPRFLTQARTTEEGERVESMHRPTDDEMRGLLERRNGSEILAGLYRQERDLNMRLLALARSYVPVTELAEAMWR